MPGAFPKYKNNEVREVVSYDERKKVFIKRPSGIIEIEAYGYVEYKKRISVLDRDAYEMVEAYLL